MTRNRKATTGEKAIAKMLGVSVATLRATQFWDDYRMAARRIDAAMKRDRHRLCGCWIPRRPSLTTTTTRTTAKPLTPTPSPPPPCGARQTRVPNAATQQKVNRDACTVQVGALERRSGASCWRNDLRYRILYLVAERTAWTRRRASRAEWGIRRDDHRSCQGPHRVLPELAVQLQGERGSGVPSWRGAPLAQRADAAA